MGYKTIPLALLFLFFALALLLPARIAAATFAAGAFLTGFGFGACFVLYAAHVAARYGTDAVARIYPLIFLAYGLAGVTGPTLGGHLHDLTGNYFWSITASMAVLAVGVWFTWRGRAFANGSAARRHAFRTSRDR
jgi:OFA family oxalate/formate antiporter-like MFS transporter